MSRLSVFVVAFVVVVAVVVVVEIVDVVIAEALVVVAVVVGPAVGLESCSVDVPRPPPEWTAVEWAAASSTGQLWRSLAAARPPPLLYHRLGCMYSHNTCTQSIVVCCYNS